jgi:hypothetical protein
MVYRGPVSCLSEGIQSEGGYLMPPEPSLVVCETASVYCPRNPAESVLYGVVSGHLETFLERQQRRDRLVPRFVERELPAVGALAPLRLALSPGL